MTVDPWESVINEWLDKTGRNGLTTEEVLVGAIGKLPGLSCRSGETRAGVILRRLGWEPKIISRRRTYFRPRGPKVADLYNSDRPESVRNFLK
jgi:hypothetical protein